MNNIKKPVGILLIVLAIAMIYFGGFHGPKVIWPPIITGIGFFLISFVFLQGNK